MKKYGMEDIRNTALVGHQSTGKTTLGEAILFNAGVTNRMGRIEDGNTMLDSTSDEIERKISINAAVAAVEHRKTKINMIDTPGYEDFIGDVVASMRVVESGVIVMSADAGVEVGIEKNWAYLESLGLPRIVVVNKMDKEHADFDKCLAEVRQKLGTKVMPLLLPIGSGESFKGVVDILKKKAFVYSGGAFTEEEVPADLAGRVDELRTDLMDFAAESDDSLLEKFLEGGELDDRELIGGLSAGCLAGTLVPMAGVSAIENIGVSQLMDFVVDLMPSPAQRPKIAVTTDGGGKETIDATPDGSAVAFVFKTLSEKHLGDLTFLRVFAGEVKTGDDLYDANIENAERIGQLYVIQGKSRVDIDSIPAGDIGAAVKLKSSKVNHTLCVKAHPVIVKKIDFPEPTFFTAIEAKEKGDMEKIGSGLHRLAEDDPSFTVTVDPEIKQTILAGQGELQIEVILARLKRMNQVDAEMAAPRIPYRETITATSEAQGKHKKQTGGRGQYGDVWLRLEPLPRGGGFEFVDAIVGGVIPGKFIPAVEKGVREAMATGVVAGYVFQDVKVTAFDGSFHTVDSSDQAFKTAGSKGFRLAVKEAKPVILEPIYEVTVTAPPEYMGDVMGDLSMRRGKIHGTEQEGGLQKIKAHVPLAELHRYSTILRSMTQGRATHHREFSHYEVLPHENAQKLIAEAEAAREDS
ncbi:MAG: elongation factor G [Candidatus Krumholzibacteriota bacterium]|nr:elongation factor G [Candidatus Krumholzibacteriota bacterium]